MALVDAVGLGWGCSRAVGMKGTSLLQGPSGSSHSALEPLAKELDLDMSDSFGQGGIIPLRLGRDGGPAKLGSAEAEHT